MNKKQLQQKYEKGELDIVIEYLCNKTRDNNYNNLYKDASQLSSRYHKYILDVQVFSEKRRVDIPNFEKKGIKKERTTE